MENPFLEINSSINTKRLSVHVGTGVIMQMWLSTFIGTIQPCKDGIEVVFLPRHFMQNYPSQQGRDFEDAKVSNIMERTIRPRTIRPHKDGI